MTVPDSTDADNTRKENYRGLLILCGITLVLFGDLLFLPGDRVLSQSERDTAKSHVYLRAYGFAEIRSGNLPLWNPMLFSGTPFLGSMQAALLYPPNAIYLVLPIQKALNFDFAGHVLLLGVFTFLWLRRWKVHWVAATYGSMIVMFGGATYLRVLAGQINVVATYAWVPLLLLAIDHIVEQPRGQRFPSGWCLIGVLATALLVLAGYPQALFISAFCVAIYTLLRLPYRNLQLVTLGELFIVAVLPIFLSAMQLWTGVAAGMESTRSEGLTYEFAASFSFPPENLFTLFVPAFFGDLVNEAYWGRWTYWDTSFFVGLPAVIFAATGLLFAQSRLRWIALTIAAISLLIAFGKYSPLHEWLFEYAPGFGQFRAPSKFLFFTSFFVAVLAALGCDRFIREGRSLRPLAWPAFFAALLLFVGAVYLAASNNAAENGFWRELLQRTMSMGDTTRWFDTTDEYLRSSARLATISLGLAAAVSALFGLAAWFSHTRPRMVYAAIAVAVLELLGFAVAYRAHFRLRDLDQPVLRSLDRTILGNGRVYPVVGYDNRISNFLVPDRTPSVWGYDPLILSRYGDLVSLATVGYMDAPRIREEVFLWAADPMGAAIRLGLVNATETDLTTDPKLLGMLQCRMIVRPVITEEYSNLLKFIRLRNKANLADVFALPGNRHAVYVIADPLPRFLFVSEYAHKETIDGVRQHLDSGYFNPRQAVVLEEEPMPGPAPRLRSATLEIVDESTDHVTLRGTLSDSAILVMTDAFAKGWRAVPLAGSVQQKYQLLPANLALRAIPMAAGEHHFRIEYAPPAYRYALVATPVSIAVFLGLTALWWWRRPKSTSATS